MSTNLTGSAYGGNLTLSNPALAISGTVQFLTANAISYAVKGQLYSLAAQGASAFPVVDSITGKAFIPLAADQACIYAFYVNAAGTISVAQGPVVKNSELTGGLAAAQFPVADDTKTPFGYVLVQASTALAAPWTIGVTSFAATGITSAFRSVMDFPAQPITG